MRVRVSPARPGCSSSVERLSGGQEAVGSTPITPTHGFEGSMNIRYCSMRYTTEELTAALKDADSLREVMTRLGIRINNGNYDWVRGLYRQAGIDIPKVFPQKNRKPNSGFQRIPDTVFFKDGVRRTGQHLRDRLLSIGWKFVCAECGLLPEWNGKPLTLQVDHIDGDRFNNVLENLRFLCPNCHAQTETFGRTKGTGIRYNYCECGVRIGRASTHCPPCSQVKRPRKKKIDWPPVEDVLQLVTETNFSQAGRILGVSDNAIRKYLKSNR